MKFLTAILFVLTTSAAAAQGNERILIEGSSTVGPFARAALNLLPGEDMVEVRQDGTGAGIGHLCSNDPKAPVIATASRQIKPAEAARCAEVGVSRLIEKPIGRDGIVLAQSGRAKPMELTARTVYLALAHSTPRGNNDCILVLNERTSWREVSDELPDREIKIIGPPRTSGTRDIFLERAMLDGARSFPCLAAMEETNPEYFERATRLRQDTHWIEGGEHDDAVAMTLHYVHDAIGIFGYAYLLNAENIEPIPFEGVTPSSETIGSGEYAFSRPLFLYTTPEAYAEQKIVGQIFEVFDSFAAMGPQGILTKMGLVVSEEGVHPELIDTASGERKAFAPQGETSGH